MKTASVVAAVLMFSTSLALAQTPSPGTGSTTNPAPTRTLPDTTQSTAPNRSDKDTPPLKGANSFTEGEAKSRAESHGFADIKDLKKDNDGIWRGHATQGGKAVEIAIDYKGNVVPTMQQ
jgi:periplasmic protein CpxP/Spy